MRQTAGNVFHQKASWTSQSPSWRCLVLSAPTDTRQHYRGTSRHIEINRHDIALHSIQELSFKEARIMRFFVLSICPYLPIPSSFPLHLHEVCLLLAGSPHFRSISNAICSAPSPFLFLSSPWKETRTRAWKSKLRKNLRCSDNTRRV
jgi:hypothetical protein